MNSNELKLFAICYIKEDEVLTNRPKIELMDYVEASNDEKILYLLQTGTVFPISEFGAELTVRGVAMTADAIQGGMSAGKLIRTGWLGAKGAYSGYNSRSFWKATSVVYTNSSIYRV